MNLVGVRMITYFKHSGLVESVTLADGTRYERPQLLDAQARPRATTEIGGTWHDRLAVQSSDGAVPADSLNAQAYTNLVSWLKLKQQVDVEWLTQLGFVRVLADVPMEEM